MGLILEQWPLLVAMVGVGAVAGVIGGLLGVGGGIVLVPAFFFTFDALGYHGAQVMQVCVATSLATIVITSARSVSGHAKRGAVDWEVLRSWAPWMVAASVAGVFVAARVPSTALQAVFGLLAGLAGLWMAFGRAHWRLAAAPPRGALRAAIAMVTGFSSTLMGIGGGTFGVPLMTLFNLPMHRAVGTASGFGVLVAVPAVAGFLLVKVADAPPWTVGAVNVPIFLLVVGSTLVTTPLGVRLAHRMNARPLRRVFALFLTLVAVNMLRKALF